MKRTILITTFPLYLIYSIYKVVVLRWGADFKDWHKGHYWPNHEQC